MTTPDTTLIIEIVAPAAATCEDDVCTLPSHADDSADFAPLR